MFSSEGNVAYANMHVLEYPPRTPLHEAPAAVVPLPTRMNAPADLAPVAVPMAPDGDLLKSISKNNSNILNPLVFFFDVFL